MACVLMLRINYGWLASVEEKSFVLIQLQVDISVFHFIFSQNLVLAGAQLRIIEFPAKRITSCCFGGPNYEELFVTCCKTGLSEDEFKNEQPLAGSVFRVTGLGVNGLPPVKFPA
jgi:hypothetical protein